MNTPQILQKSWNLMLRYRALWLFGVILALTTISFGSALWLRGGNDQSTDNRVVWQISPQDQAWIKENFDLDLPLRYTLEPQKLQIHLDDPSLTQQERSRIVSITFGILAGLLALLAVVLTLRYTAETALIRMVGDQQQRATTYRTRQGWSLGCSWTAFKLFLIDLIGFILLFLVTTLIFIPATAPVLIAISGTPAGITIGVLLMISLMLVSLAALLVIWIATSVIFQLAHQACCLENLGVFAAIWRGFRLLRAQLSGVGLTWLVVAGLDLLYPLLVMPVFILLAAIGLAVGGLLALLLGAALALVLAKATAWTIALITGLVLLALAIGIPMSLLGGLREVFKSSAWTLTYLEAASLPQPVETPAPSATLPEAGAA
jgi:hypothetical protein